MNQSKSSNKTTVTVLAILLLLAIAAGGYFWSKTMSLNTSNQELSEEAIALNELRTDLIGDIESLQKDYNEILASSDSLAIQFEASTKLLASKQAEIDQIKKQAARESAGIKAELEQLRTVKKELTALVDQLKIENTRLRKTNQNLSSKLLTSESRNQELRFEILAMQQTNSSLERENLKLMAVSTRATNIRVDLRKRDDKPTTSAQRLREIIVSFDVKHLPEAKKGEHNLYIVLKDAKGMPVAVANPVKATIKSDAGGASEEIIAQQMQTVTLGENERIQFKITPEGKSLKEGYYRVAIYTEWGLLGGAQFQLR